MSGRIQSSSSNPTSFEPDQSEVNGESLGDGVLTQNHQPLPLRGEESEAQFYQSWSENYEDKLPTDQRNEHLIDDFSKLGQKGFSDVVENLDQKGQLQPFLSGLSDQSQNEFKGLAQQAGWTLHPEKIETMVQGAQDRLGLASQLNDLQKGESVSVKVGAGASIEDGLQGEGAIEVSRKQDGKFQISADLKMQEGLTDSKSVEIGAGPEKSSTTKQAYAGLRMHVELGADNLADAKRVTSTLERLGATTGNPLIQAATGLNVSSADVDFAMKHLKAVEVGVAGDAKISDEVSTMLFAGKLGASASAKLAPAFSARIDLENKSVSLIGKTKGTVELNAEGGVNGTEIQVAGRTTAMSVESTVTLEKQYPLPNAKDVAGALKDPLGTLANLGKTGGVSQMNATVQLQVDDRGLSVKGSVKGGTQSDLLAALVKNGPTAAARVLAEQGSVEIKESTTEESGIKFDPRIKVGPASIHAEFDTARKKVDEHKLAPNQLSSALAHLIGF